MNGLCARCKKGWVCRFRQPGTWVAECGLYEHDAEAGNVGVVADRLAWQEDLEDDAGIRPECSQRGTS